MGIALTSEQIVALAPDASSVAAGRKLSSTKGWQNLGQNAQALWGECQGSALYHIAVDLTTYTTKCSCPSHKFPCKHGLGLMLLAASQPTVLGAEADPPEWVATWLEKRTAAVTAKQEKAAKPPTEKAVASQSKAAEKRGQKVDAGIAMLDLWLDDLIRNGLASVESQPTSFWENQAARMVDAQAPGLATRLRRMAEIPGSSAEWPQKLLADLGQLALLTQAYARLDHLDPSLQEDIRQSIGWTVKSDEIEARGETVTDEWSLLGQRTEDVPAMANGRMQRTWAIGATSGRTALLLQFSSNGAPFTEMIIPGVRQAGTLRFWPGIVPTRARFDERHGAAIPITATAFSAGMTSIAAYLGTVADVLARQPWQDRFLCVLRDVVLLVARNGAAWHVRDSTGAALPLAGDDHWPLMAFSGGRPIDLAAEWDGVALTPIGAIAENTYHLLGGKA